MEKEAECFVSGALATVLRVSRLTALTPLRFEELGDGWQVSLSRGSSLLGYCFIAIVNIVVLWIIICVLQVTSDTSRSLLIMEEVAVYTLVGTMVYGAPKHLRCLITCLSQLEKVNSELNIHQWSTPWTRKQITLFVTWTITSLSMISIKFMMESYLTLVVSDESSGKIWPCAMVFMHYAFYLYIMLGGTQFVLLVLHVRFSFKAVNDCLRSLLLENIMISSTPAQAVRGISSAYASTCDAMCAVDRSYGLMLLTALGTIFLRLITTSYYFILSLVYNYGTSADMAILIFKFVQFFWCVFHAVCLVLLIEPCHLTHVEMECTRELVSQLMVFTRSESDLLAEELKQFNWQLELNDISFKPLDVTTMERSLVLTIFGSITTYLVVLIDLK